MKNKVMKNKIMKNKIIYISSLNIITNTDNSIIQQTKRAFSLNISEKNEPVTAPIIKKSIRP